MKVVARRTTKSEEAGNLSEHFRGSDKGNAGYAKSQPAEGLLGNNQGLLREIVDNATVSIHVKDADGRYMYVNRRYEDLFDLKWDEVYGRTDHDIFPKETADAFRRNDQRVLETGASHEFEEVIHHKDGPRTYISHRFPLLDPSGTPYAICGTLTDITERKTKEQALKEAEKRYRALFESAGEGILVADIETKDFLYANPAACRMLGYSEEELRGMNVGDIHPEDALEHVVSEFEVQARGEKVLARDIPCQRKDGTVVYADVRTTATLVDGRECDIGFFSEATERRRAEEKFRENEERTRAILDCTLSGIVLIDAETHTIVDVNRAACEMIGAPREEIVGRICHKFICPAEQGQCPITDLGQTVDNSERVLLRADGKSMLIIKSVVSVTLSGRKHIVDSFVDITERKRTEKALIESEQTIRVMANAAQDAVIMIDNEGKTTFWNKAAERIFGYPESEAVGEDCHALLMPDEYKSAYEKGFVKFRMTGEGNAVGKTLELIAKRKDGSTFPIEISVSSIQIKSSWNAVAIVRDISERIEREDAFAETVSRYMSMINAVPAMVYLKDVDHIYVIANEVFCDFVGMKQHEIVGKTDYDIFPWEKADLRHQADRMVMDQDRKVSEHEEQIVNADGKTRWVSTTKVPLHDRQGLVSGVVALTQDVTEQHASREQLVQADKLAAIGTLAAGVAHEINNPIGFINSNLNTMGKYLEKVGRHIAQSVSPGDEPHEDVKDMLTDFKDAIDESIDGTNRVKKIVTDLKSFSRVDRAEKEHVSINDGLESTLNIVWNELKYKCKVEKDFGEIPDLYCFPNQLNQVFMNMLLNAGHAITGDSGVIAIRTWSDGDNIRVSIKDDGSGIPKESLKKIFEPFYTTKDVGKGTGLGLSLAYDIIKKHKGHIHVESKVGVGTEFVITLPLEGIEHE